MKLLFLLVGGFIIFSLMLNIDFLHHRRSHKRYIRDTVENRTVWVQTNLKLRDEL
jgi:hypothetical protein